MTRELQRVIEALAIELEEIFDDYEEQLKAKDEEIERLNMKIKDLRVGDTILTYTRR